MAKFSIRLLLLSCAVIVLLVSAGSAYEAKRPKTDNPKEQTKLRLNDENNLQAPSKPVKPIAPSPPIPQITIDVGEGREGFLNTIRIVILLTILTLAPSLLIMMTSFTRIVIVLFIFRQALGIVQVPPNQVLMGLALFLTIFIMRPALDKFYKEAFTPYSEGKIDERAFLIKAFEPFKTFMLNQVGEKELDLFLKIAGKERPANPSDITADVLIPAFMLTEVKKGFEIGFIVYIPFIMIDFVIASILMAMGMIMVPPILLSVPFKLIVFVLSDGWLLLTQSLIGSFSP